MTTIINTFLDKDNVIHSSSEGRPELTVREPADQAFFGASTLEIDWLNFNTVILQLKSQLTVKSEPIQNCVTTELFNTAGYYGYFAYPYLYGELTSVVQSGEEQIGAWMNCGMFPFGTIVYVVYRTYVPQAYQPNRVISFIR